ncbi:dihydroxyacetone kinase family protein [Streptomyces sp. NPDC054796]
MTPLHNDPQHFADEALAGFVAAHPGQVAAVHGGVVRSTVSRPGQPALVIGGGSGHYPAFAGWVGPGLAHGAACGNIFASPSASQICSVARAAHTGGGVLFAFGNYAGDVLHFGQAAEQLRAEGIDARILTVTDDIASAEEAERRRGIAGDLPVIKILGAAAEAGLGLDEVERLGRRANAATRTLGVAFSGCTLPGAEEPLFTVEPGRMALGLGIHGEPGIAESELPTADAVADLLVDGLLSERPPEHREGERRVAVLLNGLGATKYEELYVVHRRVDARLREEGLVPFHPVVGEQVTSLGMAGLSLTLTFLDDELAGLWAAPALAPAFQRGTLSPPPPRTDDLSAPRTAPVEPGTPASRHAAHHLARALRTAAETVAAQEKRLGDIDAVAGDGDHGIGMRRGTEAAARAAEAALEAGGGAKSLLVRAGEAWSERAGGTSGALWGAALSAAGRTLGDAEPVTPETAVRAVRAGLDAVLRLGGARPGDKTLVDAAVPFAERLERRLGGLGGEEGPSRLPGPGSGIPERAQPDRGPDIPPHTSAPVRTDRGPGAPEDISVAARADGDAGGSVDVVAEWVSAAEAATRAAEATADITASLGRARTHGDRSLGTPDAGAVSFALIVTAVAKAMSEPETVPGARAGHGREARSGTATALVEGEEIS